MSEDDDTILSSLFSKREELLRKLTLINNEFARVQRKQDAINSDLYAVERVIVQFGGQVSSAREPASEPEPFTLSHPNGNGDGKKRVGLRRLAKEHISDLPHEYTKDDVVRLLHDLVPDLAGINDNTLSGVMRELVADGLATIKIPATGRSPQIYERVSDI
jgi:hypothetical protein